MSSKSIIYKIGGKRPTLTKKQRLLLKLRNLPFIGGRKFLHDLICKAFKIPMTTALNQGFYCSSSLLEVGENTGLGDLFIIAYAPVKIGNHCSFSFKNMILTSTHDFEDFRTVIGKPVTIGNHVWVTSNVLYCQELQ